MTCGIYRLIFKNTDKVYIGQSTNIEQRFRDHIRYMKENRTTKKLCEAYILYGVPELDILSECLPEDLNNFENETIEIWDSVKNGFNTLKTSESTPNISGFSAGNAKYTKEDILKVAELLQDPLNKVSYIEEVTGVKSRTVTEVSNLTQHGVWLSTEYPEVYTKILALKGNRRTILNKLSASTRSNTMCALSRGIVYPLIVSPDGIVYNVTNTSAFAKEHGLHNGHLGSVLNKKALSHKGWKLA